MISKVHMQDLSHISQSSVCSVEQIVFAHVILWLYSLTLEYSPKGFCQVEMWRVWWKKEEEKSPLLPKFTQAHDFFVTVNLRVIKHDNGSPVDAKRQAIKILDDAFGVDGFSCGVNPSYLEFLSMIPKQLNRNFWLEGM